MKMISIWTGVLTTEREASHLHGGHVVRVQAEAGLEAAVEGGHQRGVLVRVGQACRAHVNIKLQLQIDISIAVVVDKYRYIYTQAVAELVCCGL